MSIWGLAYAMDGSYRCSASPESGWEAAKLIRNPLSVPGTRITGEGKITFIFMEPK